MKEKNLSIQGLRAIAFISILGGHARIGTKGVWAVCTLKKLYPLHLLLTIACFIYFGINRNRVIQLVINTFLIQSWIPADGAYFSLNGVSWYLSSSVFCYFMFPYLSRLIKKV